MMNVVSSLSNISFYGGHSILQHGKEISRILVRLLTMGVSGERNGEGEGGQKEGETNGDEEEEDDFHSWLSLECARVYGNFSRSGKCQVLGWWVVWCLVFVAGCTMVSHCFLFTNSFATALATTVTTSGTAGVHASYGRGRRHGHVDGAQRP